MGELGAGTRIFGERVSRARLGDLENSRVNLASSVVNAAIGSVDMVLRVSDR